MTRTLTLLGYVVVAAAAVALQVAARRGVCASFGESLSAAARRWPVRLLLVAAWLWLGWHVFVRVDWR
jgi:Family of unknown function (DUF6186)